MLEKLDSIDWSELSHAYGEASDVPELIRNLASSDEEIRDEALSELFGTIVHQGTVYEASAYAVPFLIELLEEPAVEGKDRILDLLCALATGYFYYNVQSYGDQFFAYSGDEELDEEKETDDESDYIRRNREEVFKGTPLYLRLLSDQSKDIQLGAIYILALCIEQAEIVEAALWEKFATEADPLIKAGIIFCLRDLWWQQAHSKSDTHESIEAGLTRLCEVMRSESEADLVRFVAALTLVGWPSHGVVDEAFSLAEQLVNTSWDGFSDLPWSKLASSPIKAMTLGFEHVSDLRLRYILDLLRNPTNTISTGAIYELVNLCQQLRSPSAKAAPVLGELLSQADEEVRSDAASTLAKIGSAAHLARESLLVALNDPDATICGYAAIALAKLGEQRAIPRIREMLRNSETSWRAVNALTKFGPAASEAIPDLIAMMKEPDDNVNKVNLLLAIGEIDNTGQLAFENVAARLRSQLALTSLYILGQWGSGARDAVPDVIEMLDLLMDFARPNAVITLGKIGEAASAAVPRLEPLLEASDSNMKVQAAMALWRINRSERAIPVLIKVIETEINSKMSDSHRVCSDAARYLGEIGTEAAAATSILRKALKHESPWVRAKAARSLWQITGKSEDILPVLIQELKSDKADMEVIECISLMGAAASAAVPELRRIVESEERLIQSGTYDEIIDNDEAYQRAAEMALKRILAESE
jgi:HEAT repeat protein